MMSIPQNSICQNSAITSELIRLVPPEKEERPKSFPKTCAIPAQRAQQLIGILQQRFTSWEIEPSSTDYNSPVFSTKQVPSGFWGTNQGNVLKLIHKHFQQTTILSQKTHEQIASDLSQKIQKQSANTGEVMVELIRRSGKRIDKNIATLPLALFQTISQSLYERLNDLQTINRIKLMEFKSIVLQNTEKAPTRYLNYVSEPNELESEKKMSELSNSERDLHELARKVREILSQNNELILQCQEAIDDLHALETTLFQQNQICLYKTEIIQDVKTGETLLNDLTSNAGDLYFLRCIEIDNNYQTQRTIGASFGRDNTVYTPRVGTSHYNNLKTVKKAVRVFFSSCLGTDNSISVTVWKKNK